MSIATFAEPQTAAEAGVSAAQVRTALAAGHIKPVTKSGQAQTRKTGRAGRPARILQLTRAGRRAHEVEA